MPRLRIADALPGLALILAIGCGVADPPTRTDGAEADRDHFIPLDVCEDGIVPVKAGAGFRHAASALVSVLAPVHAADDVIAVVDADAPRVRAKLAYGPTSKDLEDEWVEILLDDCTGGVRHLGFALTDDDGRIDAPLDSRDLPDPGRYRITVRVWGDGTTVSMRLFVVPDTTEVVVFDIDGTLTTSDLELYADVVHDLFAPILAGDVVPAAREGAAEITRLRHDMGYLPVYLTGRPYWLRARTDAWLRTIEAAPGALLLAPHTLDAWPTNAGVGTFKADALAELQLAGLDIAFAYGNATTDIWAYDQAGVPAERVFVAGPHGGENDTHAVGDGYARHLEQVTGEPGAAVPLAWP